MQPAQMGRLLCFAGQQKKQPGTWQDKEFQLQLDINNIPL
jgi:hypothetical protein